MRRSRGFLWIPLVAVLAATAGFWGGLAWSSRPGAAQTGALAPDAADAAGIPAGSAPRQLAQEELANITLFERASPSVVFITSIARQQDFFRLNQLEIPRGSGSGFVWDRDGHVVTNFHVVANANAARVTLSDQSSWDARLVGAAPEKDLAVLKIDAPAERLRPLPVGSSTDLKVGQKVLAIGNPFGLDQTLTTGIISALGREIDSLVEIPIRDVIQTDAAINPGNSGGPLLDSSGRLIGVNTAIFSPASGTYAGIGFAIPSHAVSWVVPDLINYGELRRPTLGLVLAPEALARRLRIDGAVIYRVEPGGAAAAAGLSGLTRTVWGRWELGDILQEVDGKPIRDEADLFLALEERKAGDRVTLTYFRDGRKRTSQAVLGEG